MDFETASSDPTNTIMDVLDNPGSWNKEKLFRNLPFDDCLILLDPTCPKEGLWISRKPGITWQTVLEYEDFIMWYFPILGMTMDLCELPYLIASGKANFYLMSKNPQLTEEFVIANPGPWDKDLLKKRFPDLEL